MTDEAPNDLAAGHLADRICNYTSPGHSAPVIPPFCPMSQNVPSTLAPQDFCVCSLCQEGHFRLHPLGRPFATILNLFTPYSLSPYPVLSSLVALTLPHIKSPIYVHLFIAFPSPRSSITVEILVCLFTSVFTAWYIGDP